MSNDFLEDSCKFPGRTFSINPSPLLQSCLTIDFSGVVVHSNLLASSSFINQDIKLSWRESSPRKTKILYFKMFPYTLNNPYYQPSSYHPHHYNLVDQSPFDQRYCLQPNQYNSSFINPYSDNWDHQARRADQLHQHRQQRQRELEKQAQYERELARLRNQPTAYQDAIRAERARRLAEAKARQRNHQDLQDNIMVDVTLPDGRQSTVPLSWARRMQAKYPDILSDSMIRPHPPPSSSQINTTFNNEPDIGSDFYVLDPSQDPSATVIADSSSSPLPQSKLAPQPTKPSSPKFPNRSPEELDTAARLIQQQFRAHQKLKDLSKLEFKFNELKSGFTCPSPTDLTFLNPPNQSNFNSSPSTKLAFNIPANRSVQAYEESLTQLQIQLDAIISGGNEKIKNLRKQLVKQVELELERLDQFKTKAWVTQRDALVTQSNHKSSELRTTEPEVHAMEGVELTKPIDASPQSAEINHVEDFNEIMNTDTESVASVNRR
ncbi:hypothetical protein O181_058233 [Austropuccinia psidii MF-1]|uniref:BAG domain-containing protein n=1 Tax=Austropuccinia psidii MF-1 TaxID=1389203 RepID=A0A9Q3EGH3_9BASI|nr:hypothetical protein [Austropuccinia psidii MF-1]